jgi:hypothetical protein
VFAVLIQERGLGAEQIRTTDVTATQVGAMATRATDPVDRLSARDLSGVSRWTLLPGYEATGSTPSAPLASLGGRRLSLGRALG